MKLKHFLFIIILIANSINAQISGKVVDAKTKEPLPFVNIGVNQTAYGTSTDIDGKFQIKYKVSSLQLSYVGYEPKNINIGDSKTITIELKEKSTSLKEVVINPDENPALRIIRNVIENKKQNDVEQKDYQCELYNLFKVNFIIDTTGKILLPDSVIQANYFKDSTGKWNMHNKINYNGKEYDVTKVESENYFKLFDKRPLMTLETFVKKKHIAPDRNKELITATKMSGLKNPSFLALATKIQSFSFYKNYFQIDNNQFLSPISKTGLKNYFYLIEDTIYDEKADTIFVISYRPYKGKSFEGMKGVMQISTNGFAIKNVIAEPADTNAPTQITIQQLYELDDNNQWIPKQLLGTLNFKSITNGDPDNPEVIGEIKTYIDSFDYQTKIKSREVDHIAFEITPKAHKVDSTQWEKLRKTELTEKEKFAVLEQYKDSMPSSMSFDRMLDIIRYFRTGKAPIGIFSLDLNKIINFNDFEGFRLGAGLHTNERLSKLIQVGGYYAYGFKDKQHKYGADLNFQISKKRELNFNLSYQKDVIASGYPTFFEEGNSLFQIGNYKTLLINQMDNIEKYEAYIAIRALKHFKFHFFGNIQTRLANNEYLFNRSTSNENITVSENTFFISEYGVNIRYAHNESFFYDGIDKFSLGTKWPTIYARLALGVPSNYGNIEYQKIDFKLTDNIKLGEKGVTSISINFGATYGEVPYTLLYNSPGFFKQFNISSNEVFETMRINEFLSDKYASAFWRHKFKPFPISKKFTPQLELVTNIGYGTLDNAEKHENIEFKTLENGYYESGFRLDKLLTMGFSTFGIGTFYRYGPNSFTAFKDNIAVKFVLGFNL